VAVFTICTLQPHTHGLQSRANSFFFPPSTGDWTQGLTLAGQTQNQFLYLRYSTPIWCGCQEFLKMVLEGILVHDQAMKLTDVPWFMMELCPNKPIFLGSIAVWIQSLVLVRQALYHLSRVALAIFQIGSHVHAQVDQDYDPVYTSHIAAWQCALPCPTFDWLKWSLADFCLRWPQTSVLPVSASWVDRIAGMSYHAQINPFLIEDILSQKYIYYT
jgi:hypothetical protein